MNQETLQEAPLGAAWKVQAVEPTLLLKTGADTYQATGVAGNMSAITAERVFKNVTLTPLATTTVARTI